MEKEHFSLQEYFELSGLTGIYKFKKDSNLFTAENVDLNDGTIIFKSKLIYLKLRIEKFKRLITILKFESYIPNRHFFLTVLKNMVFYATQHNFDKIKFRAEGNFYHFRHGHVMGYFVLGKYGFKMNSNKQKELLKEISKHKLKTKALDIFGLLATEQDTIWWIISGFPWNGTFYLNGKNDCHDLLDIALKKRGLEGKIE